MMSSPKTTPTTQKPDLPAQLSRIGLTVTASELDDFIARAGKHRWSPRMLLEEIVRAESQDRARRSLERRLRNARLGRFKPISDFDWNWPAKIDRRLIENVFSLDFIREGRNLILLGANGLGKTMITKNLAHQAVLAGFSVVFRTASDMLSDLACEQPYLLRRKLSYYTRPALLCIDEVGYLSYDSGAADLLYEVVNRRYERASIILTTNRAFKDWDTVFPNAACIATLLDRLTHHCDVTLIEGQSFRVRESEMEAAHRRQKLKK